MRCGRILLTCLSHKFSRRVRRRFFTGAVCGPTAEMKNQAERCGHAWIGKPQEKLRLARAPVSSVS